MRPQKKVIAVRFVQKNAPYNVGEVAGFSMEIALKLVRGKKAVFINEEDMPKADSAEPLPEEAVAHVVAVHVGGGYYEVAGHRVKGKKEAEKYAEELNSKSDG